MTTSEQTVVRAPVGNRHIRTARRLLRRPELAAVIGLAFIFGIFVVLAYRSFLSPIGIGAWLQTAAAFGIVAAPVTLLLIAGEFDLSIGSVLGLTSIFFGYLIANDVPFAVAIVLTFLVAGTIGWINGLLVLRLGISSLIVTLGGFFLYRGITVGIYTGALGDANLRNQDLHAIIDGQQPPWLLHGTVLGLGADYFWWILITIVSAFILSRTVVGNWIFASGGSAQAARSLGVPVTRVKWVLFIICSCAAALQGMMQTTEFGSVEATRGGRLELEVIVAAVIGGTFLTGGYGSPIGTAIGAVILAIAQIGLLFLGVPADWYQAVLGLMLILVVVFNVLVRRRAVRMRP